MDFLWFYNDTAGLQLKYLDNIDIFGLVRWTNIISMLLSRILYLQNILRAFIILNCLNFASLLFLKQPFCFHPQNCSCDARWNERTFEQLGMSVQEIVSFLLLLCWARPFKPHPPPPPQLPFFKFTFAKFLNSRFPTQSGFPSCPKGMMLSLSCLLMHYKCHDELEAGWFLLSRSPLSCHRVPSL